MQIKFNYKFLRFTQLLFAILVSTGVFTACYWLANMFYPHYSNNIWIIAGFFAFCAGVTILVVGSGDSSVQNWYETRLASSRELFATLYEQSPVPYMTLNGSGKITICNKAVAHLFKTTDNNIIGKKLQDLITHDDDSKLSIILGTLQAGTSMTQKEAKIIADDKEEIWVNISIFHSTRLDQRLVTLVDINALKLIDKAKSEFVSLATHQLRTPITAIKWNLDLLSKSSSTVFDKKQTDYLIKARRNVVRMIALINDFLNVSKLETGIFTTTLSEIQLDNYLRTIIDEFQQGIEEKSIIIKDSFLPAGLNIRTDENLFHIITSNLLSNAVKYTKENSEIFIKYVADETNFQLTISDSGIGVPSHELDNLFKKFFRASNAQLIRTEGTGLGLYIVKESVDKLGGTIEVESTENVGTIFTVNLPIKQTINS